MAEDEPAGETGDGMTAVEPGPIARICDAAHAADEGHSSGFCRECAAIALALSVAPVEALLDLLVERGALQPEPESAICRVFWGSHGCGLPRHHKPASRHVCDPGDPCSMVDIDDEGWRVRFRYEGGEWSEWAPASVFGEDVPPRVVIEVDSAGKCTAMLHGNGQPLCLRIFHAPPPGREHVEAAEEWVHRLGEVLDLTLAVEVRDEAGASGG